MNDVDVWADTRAQLTAAWDVRGIDVATIAAAPGAMHVTQRRLMTGPVATTTLPPLLTARGEVPPSFSLGRTLGRGGLGVVRAATQQALDREVAIKCLRDDDEGARAAPQLLREARVVGALEHPNIVPVHALGADESGRPILVMKRIDGVGWDEALADENQQADPEAFLTKMPSPCPTSLRGGDEPRRRGTKGHASLRGLFTRHESRRSPDQEPRALRRLRAARVSRRERLSRERQRRVRGEGEGSGAAEAARGRAA